MIKVITTLNRDRVDGTISSSSQVVRELSRSMALQHISQLYAGQADKGREKINAPQCNINNHNRPEGERRK